MTDDIVQRLRYAEDNGICEWQVLIDAIDEIERLRAAIDSLLADIDSDHEPEWASDEAKKNGKKPWCCRTCGAEDGSWPCTHRMALDELKEARRG